MSEPPYAAPGPPPAPHGWLTIDARTYLDASARNPPRIIIDGHEVPNTAWGRSTFPLAAGTHTVHCGRRFSRGLEPSTVTISVAPGEHVRLEYRGPLSRGFDGVLGPAPQKPPGLKSIVFAAVGTVVAMAVFVAVMVLVE